MVAVLVSGVMHGYLDGRWTDRPNLEEIGGKLNQLPAKCGDWELVAETDLDDQAQSLLRCYGSTIREYWKPSTGQRVNAAVFFGPRGPIAVHVPEVCYSSQGTEPVGPRIAETIQVGDRTDQLWKVLFSREQSKTPHLEVWYGWSDGGAWEAADYPRVWMTDRLYKIQVAGTPAPEGEPSTVKDFLQAFLPTLKQ